MQRSLTRSQTTAQQATKKSKDVNNKRGVTTLATTEKDSRWSLWDKKGLDPEEVVWFFYP
eukprot:scaffold1356_cov123-Cylindrotheca_fusiformis.AAC.52